MEHGHFTFSIIPSRTGAPTITVSRDGQTIPLHSAIDPLREAERFRGHFHPGRFDLLIVLGVGLGYHLVPLKELLHSYRKIILVDIIPGLEEEIRRNEHTSFLCENRDIVLITGEDPRSTAERLSGLIDLSAASGIEVVEHPASMKIFHDYYSQVRQTVERLIGEKAGNLATRKAFGWRFLKNIIRQLKRPGELSPINHLLDAFPGYPALIAASGPSLDPLLDLIKQFQGRFFILCADSAARCLIRAGIQPDFIVTVDPQAYTREHLQGLELGRALVLGPVSASPPPVNKNRFVYLNSHPLCQVLASSNTIVSLEHETGTVAGEALRLSNRLGFGPVLLAGYDFSFPRGTIYPRGSAYQERYGLLFQDRLMTVEGRNMGYIRGASGNIRESGLSTRRSFLQYRTALEKLVGENPGSSVFQENGAGLDIRGTGRLAIEHFAAKYCAADIDKEKILSELAGGAPRLNGQVTAYLKTRLQDRNLFSEMISLSLHRNDEKTGEKVRKLIDRL